MIFTLKFWRGAGERAIKTGAQTFTAVFSLQVLNVITPAAAGQLPWASAAITAGVAALLSIFTSIGNADFTAGTSTARRALES